MKKLTKEQIEKASEMALNGAKTNEIATALDILPNSVSRLLKRIGSDLNNSLSEDVLAEIYEKYKTTGVSVAILSQSLGKDPSTISRNLIKAGYELRKNIKDKRNYNIIDENYFESIDTEEKAYFLGIIISSGYIAKNSNLIKLILSRKHINILQTFSNYMYGFQFIKNNKENIDQLYVKVSNKKLYNSLINLGLHNKETITFPKISDNFILDFLRGFIEGNVLDYNNFLINFNKLFLSDLKKVIKNSGIEIFDELFFKDHNLKVFLDKLYLNSSIHSDFNYNFYLNSQKEKKRYIKNKVVDISNYNAFIPTINGFFLSKENVNNMSKVDKQKIAKDIALFYQEHGFPYIKLSKDEIIKDFSKLRRIKNNDIEKSAKILSQDFISGLDIVYHFSPHFYEVKSGRDKQKKTMIETFNNIDNLETVILNRLNKGFQIDGLIVRRGLYQSKTAFRTSVFNPGVAKFIFSNFTKDGDIIYDYSMGFGHRLLGALAVEHKLTYIGVDPYTKSVDSNINIFNAISENIPNLNKNVDIINCGSENYCNEKYIGKVKLAFSSPPYYNLERYEQSQTQAYSAGYSDFINIWWRKTVQNIKKLLSDDGLFIINISDRKVDNYDVLKEMMGVNLEEGFELIDKYNLQIRTYGKKDVRYEPILILKRKK